MTYAELLQENRRLHILRTLADAPAYTANEEILVAMLAGQGVAGTQDQVTADMEWLAETGLCRLEDLGDALLGTITERGLDVARGLTAVRGVRRPSPRMLRRFGGSPCLP